MRGLPGNRTVITGGASGIGAATAARFIDEQARVVIVDRDAAACRRIRAELSGLIGTVEADVSDHRAVERAYDEVDRLLGGVDVLINNAGISIRHRFLEIAPTEWSRVMSVNLDGVFFMAQAAARRRAEGGAIINIRRRRDSRRAGQPVDVGRGDDLLRQAGVKVK